MQVQSEINEADRHSQAVALREMGSVAWLTVALGAGLILSYAAILLALGFDGISVWLACALCTPIAYACYTVVHEAVHGSINGKQTRLKWLNELLGYTAAQIVGASFVAHRKEHLAHHRYTNIPRQDPDLKISSGGFIRLIPGVFRAIPLQISYYLENNWAHAPNRDRLILLSEVIIAIVWRVLFVIWVGWEAGLIILAGATAVGNLITLTFFAWIVHRPHKNAGRFKDTSTFVFPPMLDRVVSWLWFFQNYHSIHHLFPRVPFYRYRHVFQQIEGYMRANGSPIIEVGKLASRSTSHA